MRKIYFSILALVLFAVTLSASQRSASDALQIAINHLKTSTSSDGRQKTPASKNLQLAYTFKENVENENGLLYVFNNGNNNGFVIVSGSEKATEILGYAHTGTFDASKIPTGLNYWLNGFAEEIKLLENAVENTFFEVNASKEPIRKTQAESLFSTAISPLLGSIKWNQGQPYNNLCPIIPGTDNRAVTGCVATGMAQVMKYHQWPVTGIDSNSYTTTTQGIPLSVDFSTTTYDWANMTNGYNAASTENQKTAVATLMYHCGVATNMDYDLESGTTTLKMATALINNYGYDANLNLIKRDFYTREEWINMLKTELNASRPVLYGGQSSTSGHLFVCDGYDSNNFFHFNWGWGGMSDGYYAITALNPSNQGIGGSSGGYNSYQDIVVGMQQPDPTTSPVYCIYMQENIVSSEQSVQRNANTTIAIKKTYNYGVNTFNGNLGLGLFNGDNLIAMLKNYAINGLVSGTGYNNINAENITIPSQTANGTYKLHTIYKASSESDWSIVRGYVGTPNYLYVQVSDTEVSYTNPADYDPNLTLNSMSVTGNVYQNKTGRFVVEVTNTGEEYNSKLGIYLQLKDSSSVYQLITEDANIATNETATYYINKKITLNPGEYYLAAMYDPNNVRETASAFSQLGSTQLINILATPTDPPAFMLNSKIAFPDNDNVNKNYDILSANITNSGGYYENKMIAFIFPKAGGSSLTYLGYQDVFFETDEQKTVNFGGSINLEPDQYLTITYYLGESGWVRLLPNENSSLLFTIQPEYTTIETIPEVINHVLLYPNPANDYIYFKSEEIVKDVYVYSAEGKLLQRIFPNTGGVIQIDIRNFNTGTYLLQINTSGNIQIGQFIKQ
jgi:hypothetical protein